MYDYYPKLYLRTRYNVDLSTESFPLGFATHFQDDKAFESRKFTVDNWAVPYYTKTDNGFGPFYIDNVPVSGFRFDTDVSRSRTDNKWYRIKDPRGFTLEISSENLSELILTGELNRGGIIGNHVWVRHNNTNYLMHETNEKLVMVEGDKTGIKVGDIVTLSKLERATYVGVVFTGFEIDYDYNKRGEDPYKNGYGRSYELYLYPNYSAGVKYHAFVYTNHDGNHAVHLVKSMPKYRIVGKDENFDPAIVVGSGLVNAPNSGCGYKGVELFATKDETKNRLAPTADQVKVLVETHHTWYVNRYDVYYSDRLIINGWKKDTQ